MPISELGVVLAFPIAHAHHPVDIAAVRIAPSIDSNYCQRACRVQCRRGCGPKRKIAGRGHVYAQAVPEGVRNVYTQGVAGTGEITGRTFQGNQNISAILRHPLLPGFPPGLLNGQANFSTRVAFLVTGAPGPDGSVPSFNLQATLHLRFHANGTVTVKLNNFTTDCGDGAGFWDYREGIERVAPVRVLS